MKTVFFQGSFDLLHHGHIRAIKKAKEVAKHIEGMLIIGLNTDELYKKYKEKMPVILYKHRKEMLEALKYVDEVITACEYSPIQILEEYDIDIYMIY